MAVLFLLTQPSRDRKSTRLNSSHRCISYAVFCLKKKKVKRIPGISAMCTLIWVICFSTDQFLFLLFFFNDTATPEIYTLSLPDALPICFTTNTNWQSYVPEVTMSYLTQM